MKIANYELHAIETGSFALDGGAMFGVVPKTLWERAIPPDEKNRIPMAARPLLLVGNGRKILIDVGNGSKMNEKLSAIYKIDSSKNDLLSSLQQLNINLTDITDVILTHLHFDHCGGSTFRDNDGEVKPSFPNAQYYVQRDHWEWAQNPTERDKASFFPDDYMPLYERGILNFTEGEEEILPNISCRICNGHTTSLQAPLISDGTTSLLYVADLMPTIAHVQLPWIMGYDLRPLVTLEEKRRILNEAVDGKWTLFFEHDATTQTCMLQRTEKGIVAINPSPLQ
jgi:glyoxylase-like metal-dependent hydrolase (beta-lactamase superfamily II)